MSNRSKVSKSSEGKTWELIGNCENPELYAIRIKRTGLIKYIRKCNYEQREPFRTPFIPVYNDMK